MSDKTDTDSGTVTITASSVEELLQKYRIICSWQKAIRFLRKPKRRLDRTSTFAVRSGLWNRDNSKHGGAVGNAEPVAEKEK